MKVLRVAFCVCLCAWTAACGSSASTNPSDDATADVPDAAIGDTAGGDAPDATGYELSDTASYLYPTCAAIADCAQLACANSTSASCAANCLAGGAPAALPAATAMLTCVQAKCVDGQCKGATDPKCLSDCSSLRCMPKIFDCIEDGKSGSGTCSDVKTCFDTCNAGKTGVMSCMQACYEKVSAAAKAQAKPFADCLAAAPGSGDPTAACGKEAMGCFLAGKTGTKGCYDSLGCLGACDKSSDPFSCGLACLGEMSQAGQDAYTAVAPCLGQDITATAGCEDKLVVCLAPTGTQTCAEALGCVMGCGGGGGGNNDPTCTFTCLHNTTAAADKLLFSNIGCDQGNPSCAAGIVQCLAPSGTTSCPDIIGCVMGCSSGPGQPPDIKCMLSCIKKGSLASATAAYGELNCMGKADPACLDKGVACFNPTGTNNCAMIGPCVQGCYAAGGDIAGCQNGCYGKASVQGFKDFQQWNACQQSCAGPCKPGDQICVNNCASTQCPTVMSACNPT